jgi:hypothetical protein
LQQDLQTCHRQDDFNNLISNPVVSVASKLPNLFLFKNSLPENFFRFMLTSDLLAYQAINSPVKNTTG